MKRVSQIASKRVSKRPCYKVLLTHLLAYSLFAVPALWAAPESYYHYLQALLAERRGDVTTALSEYTKTVELDPQAVEVYRDLAQLSLRTGRTQTALQAAERIKELAPKDASSFLFLGHVNMAKGDVTKAAEYYEKALQLDPQNLQALGSLATYYAVTHPSKAVTYYQRYLAGDPQNAEVYFQLGLIHQKEGRYDQAIEAYKKSAEIDPQQVAPHLAMAELYEASRSTGLAQAAYEACLAVDKRNALCYVRLGHLYYQQKKWEEASSQFQSARVVEPNDPSILYWLARTAEERKLWKDAAGFAEAAYQLKKDPQFLPLLSYYLTLDNRIEEAVQWLEKSRKTDPDNPNTLLFLGMGYLELKKPKKAMVVLEKGCRLHADDPQLHFQLGTAYDRMGRFDPAMAEFEKVLQLDPRNTAAMNYIGYSYAERGIRLKDAEKYLREAVKDDSTNGAFLDSLGWVLYKEGNIDESLGILEQAVQRSPDALIFEHLGEVYWEGKKSLQAMEAWSKSLALNKDNRALRKKVETLSQQVIPGSNQRKYLKYVEGNFRQIIDLQGRVVVRGRWKKDRIKTQGDVLYQRPDRLQVDVWETAPEPVARVFVEGKNVRLEPQALADRYSGLSLEGLTWLPRLLSGEIVSGLDDPGVKTERDNSWIHYTGVAQEAWVNPINGWLMRFSRENPLGGRDVVNIPSYSLVDGLWVPDEMALENKTQGWKARLTFSSWSVNSPK